MDVSSRLARSAAYHIGQDFLYDRSLVELSDKLGVSSRHLRRVFQAELGVSPADSEGPWKSQPVKNPSAK